MKKYETYKPSGLEWIGNIPVTWSKKKLKYLFNYKKGSNGQKLTKEFIGENPGKYPVYSGTTKGDGELGRTNEYEFDLKDEVIFVSTVGSDSTVMSTRMLNGKFNLSQNCLIMIPKISFNIKFVYYLTLTDFPNRRNLLPVILKEGHRSVGMSDLDEYEIFIPSISEQQQIVQFLDEKTEIIDKLISMKERKIDLLKSQRKSLIELIITKGLNPNVKLKNSGIDWIGEIPEHWKITPLRYLGYFQNGISKSSEYFGTGFPFMNYNDVYKNEITPESLEGRVQSTESDRKNYSILRGDVFFTRTSESKDDIGVSSTCLQTIPESVFSGFLIRFRFFGETHIPEYSKSHFQTHWKKVFIESKMDIVTRSSLSQQILGQVPVLIPPIHEQHQIVEYLDTHTKEIDDLISLEQKKSRLLKEYKQSLISEIVTGKIDVRTNVN
jgi:type I restriction enzyme, S subunit